MSRPTQLGALADIAPLAQRLAASGLSDSAAVAKANLTAAAAQRLLAAGHSKGAEAHAFFVPGRIEILGKHTDYAGGASMTAAVERGFAMVAAGTEDQSVCMTDAGSGRRCEFAIAADLEPAIGHWSNYPMTVARRLARNFARPPLRGAAIAFASDLPPEAGMSSSSALMVATFLCISAVNDLARRDEYKADIDSPESLAEFLGTIENGQTFRNLAGDAGVGTFGGSEDHTAMLSSQAGMLSEYSYCPVKFRRRIRLPGGYTFAVASSGIAAAKTGAAREKYNRASMLCRAVAEAWREATGRDDPHIAAALAGPPDAIDKMRAVLRRTRGTDFTTAELLGRFEHFVIENEQVIGPAGDALAAGDTETFGRLVDRSQKAAEDLLANQIAETVFLAAEARRLGAAAASAFGAGFGGSVWALVGRDEADAFLSRWQERYAEKFPGRANAATFFCTPPGPAAFQIR